MACSNCFNGCADIISDQCVKYTGVDIPGLGITNGDPLLVVENQIISKILELITGEGIIPILDPLEICPFVAGYLPLAGDITLNHVISALFQSICNLEGRLTTAEGTLVVLDADYVIGCLSGVSPDSGTHAILQATIEKLCIVDSSLTALSAELHANYVLISDIDDYIGSYIAGSPVSTLYNRLMIPYTAIPYFGVLTGLFDITGAGIGDWINIYLCNGQNGTPDLRGRALVGATTMGSTNFDPAVDPANPANPTYAVGDPPIGANQAFITSINQMPSHTHSASVQVYDPGHAHAFSIVGGGDDHSSGNHSNKRNDRTENYVTAPAVTGIGVSVTIGNTGGSSVEGHNNIQPVHAAYYIMYIP